MATTDFATQTSAPRPRVLCVDDEELVLEGLRDVLRRSFDVKVATSGPAGLQILRSDPGGFAIVISDMRMPLMPGADFLREARLVAPDAVRMLLTGDADLHAAIKAVNGARLFRFLTKPCDSGELMRACAAALGQHRLQTAERVLLKETLVGSVDALAEVLALTNPAAFGRGLRVKTLAGNLAKRLELPNAWEVEVAAMLAHIGAVTLPQSTAEKLYAGSRLTAPEMAMVEHVPAVTTRLLSKIPRLEGVIEILAGHQQLTADVASESDIPIPVGAHVLLIASDYDVLESQGTGGTVALGTMHGRGIYDPQLLQGFGETIGVGAPAKVLEITLSELRTGMTLADDVRDTREALLVARGQPVTDHLIARLANLDPNTVGVPLRVFETAVK